MMYVNISERGGPGALAVEGPVNGEALARVSQNSGEMGKVRLVLRVETELQMVDSTYLP